MRRNTKLHGHRVQLSLTYTVRNLDRANVRGQLLGGILLCQLHGLAVALTNTLKHDRTVTFKRDLAVAITNDVALTKLKRDLAVAITNDAVAHPRTSTSTSPRTSTSTRERSRR